MGCWIGALGRLTVLPEPTEELIREYISFSKNTCPKGYSEDEVFPNTWYFDENNNLASTIGKFAEPSIWYKHLKENFFEKRGYQLLGEPVYIGEGEMDIWKLGKERDKEMDLWRKRTGQDKTII